MNGKGTDTNKMMNLTAPAAEEEETNNIKKENGNEITQTEVTPTPITSFSFFISRLRMTYIWHHHRSGRQMSGKTFFFSWEGASLVFSQSDIFPRATFLRKGKRKKLDGREMTLLPSSFLLHWGKR